MKFQLRKNGGSSHGMVTRMQINRRPCRSRSAEKRERQKLRTAIIALKGSFSRRERMNGNRNIVGHRFFLLFLFFSPFFFCFLSISDRLPTLARVARIFLFFFFLPQIFLSISLFVCFFPPFLLPVSVFARSSFFCGSLFAGRSRDGFVSRVAHRARSIDRLPHANR